jgi:hypothetical protein
VAVQTVFIHKVVSVTIGALDGSDVIAAVAHFKMVGKLGSSREFLLTNFTKSGHVFGIVVND